ncbi:Spo0B domain-containing protein [Virgibacillus ainsalahensis]
MNENDVLTLLQRYRHDLMNTFQVVQGYLSMGKTDKVGSKIKENLAYYNEERKLMSLNAPKFILWLIQFNHLYPNLRMTYKIHAENKNLHAADEHLIENCKWVLESFMEASDETEVYEVNLEIQNTMNSYEIEVSIFIDSEKPVIINMERLQQNNRVHVKKTTNGINYKLLIPCSI